MAKKISQVNDAIANIEGFIGSLSLSDDIFDGDIPVNQIIINLQNYSQRVNAVINSLQQFDNAIQEKIQESMNFNNNKISFNLNKFKKISQIATDSWGTEMPIDDANMELDFDIEGVNDSFDAMDNDALYNLQDGGDLKTWLEGIDINTAIETLSSLVSENEIVQDGNIEDPLEIIKGGVERFYQEDMKEQEKLKIAMDIFDILPSSVKGDTSIDGTIEAPYQDNSIVAFVEETNNSIKKIAETDVRSSKTFNLYKSAQAKSIENVVMYGPGQTRVDPFLRQPISDWHLVERNKGFGLVVDDIWNIDWEAIWRSTIMDKYSRAYRDTNGDWVGGYLQKRFEVDKWVPEENNIQLKPGQKRKEYDPARGNMEARLEDMRAKEADKRGYAPASEGKPFNWKEAKKKSIIKEPN
ncbi:MAG: hypothetical protein WDA06_11000 [Phenylobacterium sp.]